MENRDTSATRRSRFIGAPRSAVYRALLDRDAVQQWMVPDGMTISHHLRDSGAGTEVVAGHEGPPPAVSPDDNDLGWRISLAKLAALVRAGSG